MNLIEKLKNVFKSKIDNNEELTDEFADSVGPDDIVGTTKSHLVGLHNRIENLNKANGLLIKENKALKENNDKLLEKINKLELELEKSKYSNNNFVYESKPVFMELPKQEPIRPNKPKRNRNNRRRSYKGKSSSNKNTNEEIYANEVNLIRDEDIPKSGSGEKVEFKNGNPVRRRRRRKKVEEIQK